MATIFGRELFDTPAQLDPSAGEISRSKQGLFSTLGRGLEQAGLAFEGRTDVARGIRAQQAAGRSASEAAFIQAQAQADAIKNDNTFAEQISKTLSPDQQKLFDIGRTNAQPGDQVKSGKEALAFQEKDKPASQALQLMAFQLAGKGDLEGALSILSGRGSQSPVAVQATEEQSKEAFQKRQEDGANLIKTTGEFEKDVEKLIPGIKETTKSKLDKAKDTAKEIGGGEIPVGATATIAGVSIPLNRKYTEGELKSLTNADALNSEISDLKKLIDADLGKPLLEQSGFQGVLPFGLFKEKGQEFALLKNSINERLLRLRSGAQINEKEYQRFRKLLPSVFRKDNLDLNQLSRFEDEFNGLKSRIISGSLWDKKSKSFTVGSVDVPTEEGGGSFTLDNVLEGL